MRIFVSYRRRDVGGYAGRLRDALAQRLGEKNVFQDVEAIAPGQDFTEAIRRALDDCDAVLAVIGPGWIGAEQEGTPRLAQAGDFVRLELATALTRDMPVVPVLLGGARMPEAADLPDDLETLSRRQAVVVRDESWRQDVDGLLQSLREEIRPPRARPRRGALVALAVVVVVLAGLFAWSLRSDEEGGAGDEQAEGVAPCVPPGARAGPRSRSPRARSVSGRRTRGRCSSASGARAGARPGPGDGR